MTVANWKTQSYNVIQSLLFNNPHRVVGYQVRDEQGNWRERKQMPAPVRRLFETEAPHERTCLRTIQFVHHVIIPPDGRHVAEIHIHPDAEEIVVVTKGEGTAVIGAQARAVTAGDVVYVAPSQEHEFRNPSNDLLGLLFVNVPTGDGLNRLAEAQAAAR